MKKSGRLFFAFFLLIGVGILFIFPHFIRKPISKVLETEAYSYLSKEAKEYIKEVYEESGEVILTEKNKKENEPYLNPNFAAYLSKTPEEQEKIDNIPVPYIVEYTEPLEEVGATYPTSYDLRNVNGKNFVTPIKNQDTLNLCWSFTTAEQIESLLLVKNNTSYNSNSTLLSTRLLDYATSTNGIADYYNDFGTRALVAGGNFLTSTIVAYNGLGLSNESYMPFDYSTSQKELATVLNYNKSLYELNASARIPMITSSSTAAQKESFVNSVKQMVMQYGGAYVGTQGPGYSCSINTSGNSALIRVDDGCVEDSGHAMQIIGWDDNYSYSYCKESTKKHTTNTSNCSGSVVSGRGAWLLRNSWGNSYQYVHLAYDSINDDVYVFQDVSSMSNRNWDNNYHKMMDSFYINYSASDTQYYVKTINTSEKVKKIKFFAFSSNGTYRISFNTNTQSFNNIKTVSTTYPGIYTVDLSDLNIVLEGDQFSVTVTSTNSATIMKKSLAVFTSNEYTTPSIQSDTEKIELDSLSTTYTTRLYSNTKNIPANSTITYSLWNPKGENVSNYISTSNTTVAKNDVNASLSIRSTIPDGKYTLKLTYQNAVEEIPVRIGDPVYYSIHFDANGGTGSMSDQRVEAYTNTELSMNSYLRTGYDFLKWNTKSDGSGVSYDNLATILVDGNITLYAQWKPNIFTVQFSSNGGTGVMGNQTFTYDVPQALGANRYTRENYIFTGWNTKSNGRGDSYSDQEVVSNLTPANNGIVTLYAQWQERQEYVRVYFKPNGGVGDETYQTVRNSETFTLNANTFTRVGYTYSGWNTKADGTGISYGNQQQITGGIQANLTLYAKWVPYTYSIRFHSNGGAGNMSNQTFTYDVAATLNDNQFTKENYRFTGWNTKTDGSGTSYQNKQSVINLTNENNKVINLYAQWVEKPASTYTIEHYDVDMDNMIIKNVEANTSLSTYQSYFDLGDGYTITVDTNGKEYIGTGSVVKVFYEGELEATYTNIVPGDPSGDGKITYMDYVAVYNHIYKTNNPNSDKRLLTGVYFTAGDMSGDSKITYMDYVKIYNTIKGGN